MTALQALLMVNVNKVLHHGQGQVTTFRNYSAMSQPLKLRASMLTFNCYSSRGKPVR